MTPKEKITLKKLKNLLENPPENLSVEVYDESKENQSTNMKSAKKKKNRYTLAQIGRDLAMLNQKVDNVNIRIDQIEARIDGIGTRLDYNNLKRVPENK